MVFNVCRDRILVENLYKVYDAKTSVFPHVSGAGAERERSGSGAGAVEMFAHRSHLPLL